MIKGSKFWKSASLWLWLLFLFVTPVASVDASGGKSTVGITIQEEAPTINTEQSSTSEKKTYRTTNGTFPKTGEKIQMQYILLGLGIIGLLYVRRGFSYDEIP
ncbi:LPXTG cell wall anchor domain-containing protein [Enterococcus sp. BWR-S5]|uniref:LPXTG cell wall anchor domain-containing protein n=1 Tax=Enterococcus sp. BWR-S5 TaxID=2787714 RepID=UPI001924B796|nr:LPXTG cell wall anchor domain-containing protein [Enterococcus sp. BWR-S5]MBL1225435.1 LPXTG cell wall anchor domain-containing protein [Enterococcus sp. BWR-S5]